MNGLHQWGNSGVEPSIAELLSDPITQAVMRADGVRVKDVLAIIRRVQCRPNALRLLNQLRRETLRHGSASAMPVARPRVAQLREEP